MEPVMRTPPDVDEPRIEIELTQEQLGDLAFIVHSKAYAEFYRPFLVGMLRSFYDDLGDPSRKRKWDKPSNYLRGGIAVVRALLNFPHQQLEEARLAAEAATVSQSGEEQYEQRRETGAIGPTGAVDEDEF